MIVYNLKFILISEIYLKLFRIRYVVFTDTSGNESAASSAFYATDIF